MALNETPSARPYWPIALALVVGVAVLVTAGVMLSGRFRTPVGVQPAPSIGIATSPSASTPAAAPPTSAVANPQPQGQPTSSISASAALAQEVQQAYLHYWDVRSQAYLNDDGSHLGEVMAGAELDRGLQRIKSLQAQGRAIKVDVEHHPLLVSVSADKAVVYDEYLNRSLFIDVATHEVLPTASPAITEKISYDLQKLDGAWKVVDGAQHD